MQTRASIVIYRRVHRGGRRSRVLQRPRWHGDARGLDREYNASLAPKLDPNTIPKFKSELPRFFTYHPKLIKDAYGERLSARNTRFVSRILRAAATARLSLTQLFGYGGNVLVDDYIDDDALSQPGCSTDHCQSRVAFRRTSPGPKFEQTKGIPALIHYRNEIEGRHPLR